MPPASDNKDHNSHTRKPKGTETTDYAKRMEPQHRQSDRNITPNNIYYSQATTPTTTTDATETTDAETHTNTANFPM